MRSLRTVTAVSLTVLALTTVSVSAQDVVWIRQLASTDSSTDPAGVGVDAAGNLYVAGAGETTLPSGSFSVASTDSSIGFLRKYHAPGNVAWTRTIRSSEDNAFVSGLAVAPSGETAIVGGALGTLPGQTASGGAFIRRYDPDGIERWTRQLEATDEESLVDVAFVGSDIVVAGTTRTALPGNVSAGAADGFIERYSATGELIWVRQFGTTADDFVTDLATDPGGGVSAVGLTFGTFPGSVPLGETDSFLARVSSDGGLSWIRQYGTAGFDTPEGVAVDPDGNSYTVANIQRTFDFDWSVRKFDSNGTLVWERTLGLPDRDEKAWDAAADASGVYVTGHVAEFFLVPQPPHPGDGPAAGASVTRLTFDGAESWTTLFAPGEISEQPQGRKIGLGDRVLGVGGVGPPFVAKLTSGASCAGTAVPEADETGPVSAPIHRGVEPVVGPAGPVVHDVNCTVIAPLGL